MKKLVAESLSENLLTESILTQYQNLDKGNATHVKEFALKLALRKYGSSDNWPGDGPTKMITHIINNWSDKQTLDFLQKAAANKFAGKPYMAYADPTTKTGRTLVWKVK